MENENTEPGTGGPDNSFKPDNETQKSEAPSQSLWGELSEDDKAVISNKGFKAPADLLKSYQELEKSSSSRFSIPKDDDEQGWRKLYAKLGMPDDISGYDLNLKKEDAAYGDAFKKACLDAGLNNKQVVSIYKWYTDNQNRLDDAFNQKSQAEQEEVKNLWGTDYDANMEIMKRGFKVLDLPPEYLENIEIAIGSKNFMLLGKHIGDLISEDTAAGLNAKGIQSREMSTEAYLAELFAKASAGR